MHNKLHQDMPPFVKFPPDEINRYTANIATQHVELM